MQNKATAVIRNSMSISRIRKSLSSNAAVTAFIWAVPAAAASYYGAYFLAETLLAHV